MELLVVVIVMVQLTVVWSGWTANNYPNPQTDTYSCNRVNKSSVCDPEELVSRVDANQLDTDIAGVEPNVKATCRSLKAFRIRVALVDKLEDTSSELMTGTQDEISARKMKRALDLMRSFASETQKRWNHNQGCQVHVIIAYSRQDGMIYTFASDEISQEFTPFIINDITSRANVNEGHLADGLRKMIRHYGEVFSDTYKPSYTPMKFVPKYAPVKSLSTAAVGCLHSHLAVVLTALAASFLLSRTLS